MFLKYDRITLLVEVLRDSFLWINAEREPENTEPHLQALRIKLFFSHR